MGSTFEPPVQYLRDCSDNSLRHFEVVKLEHVANLRRELRALWDEMLEESALALLARWMIENRSYLRSSIHPVEPPLAALGEPASLPKSSTMVLAEGPEFQGPAAAPPRPRHPRPAGDRCWWNRHSDVLPRGDRIYRRAWADLAHLAWPCLGRSGARNSVGTRGGPIEKHSGRLHPADGLLSLSADPPRVCARVHRLMSSPRNSVYQRHSTPEVLAAPTASPNPAMGCGILLLGSCFELLHHY